MKTYRLVESHNSGDTALLEVVAVVIWGEGLEAVVDSSNIGGTRKRQQLAYMHHMKASVQLSPACSLCVAVPDWQPAVSSHLGGGQARDTTRPELTVDADSTAHCHQVTKCL